MRGPGAYKTYEYNEWSNTCIAKTEGPGEASDRYKNERDSETRKKTPGGTECAGEQCHCDPRERPVHGGLGFTKKEHAHSHAREQACLDSFSSRKNRNLDNAGEEQKPNHDRVCERVLEGVDLTDDIDAGKGRQERKNRIQTHDVFLLLNGGLFPRVYAGRMLPKASYLCQDKPLPLHSA